MPTIDKVVDKMRRQPNGITVSEASRVLRYYGYDLIRQEGSHIQFKNRDRGDLITIVAHGGQLKRSYVEDILHRIGGNRNEEDS